MDILSSESYKYLKQLIKNDAFADSSRPEFFELKEYNLISHIIIREGNNSIGGYKANSKSKNYVREQRKKLFKPLSYLLLTIFAGLIVYFLGALLLPLILQIFY